MKTLITGVSGQDGSYLAEFLVAKGYEVFGLFSNPDELGYATSLVINKKVVPLEGDLTDLSTIRYAMEVAMPDEVYNFAGISDLGSSERDAALTWDVNYAGVGRIMHEAIHANSRVKMFQASSSQIFGPTPTVPQSETTSRAPHNEYAKAKYAADQDFIQTYRNQGYFLCSGILFNHESPRRGMQFVTRKIANSIAKIKLGTLDSMSLGFLDTKRDWGYAKDFVEAAWLMLQQDKPDDYVLATGVNHTVREFVEVAARAAGTNIYWKGEGVEEQGIDDQGVIRVKINPEFYRPNDVSYVLGDPTKAKEKLGWNPQKTSFEELVKVMVEDEIVNELKNPNVK